MVKKKPAAKPRALKKAPAAKPKPKAVAVAPAPKPVIVERIEEVYTTPEETIVVETVVLTDAEPEMSEDGKDEGMAGSGNGGNEPGGPVM